MLVKEVKSRNKKVVNVISQVPKGWKSGRNQTVKLCLLSFVKLARSSYRKDRHPNINSQPYYIAPPFTDNVKKIQDLIHLHVSSSRPPTIPWKEELVLLGPDSLWGLRQPRKQPPVRSSTVLSLSLKACVKSVKSQRKGFSSDSGWVLKFTARNLERGVVFLNPLE